jgi:hypothetical protein
VLSSFRCVDYTVVSSICKNKVLNILSYLKNFWVNRPVSTRCAQQVALRRLHCCFFNLQNKVLNILSYLKNCWPNWPECQRVVLSRLRCVDYTVVSSICKNKVLNISSYLKNYWANRPECLRVELSRLRSADYTDNHSICKNKCFRHFVISQKVLAQSTLVSTRCAEQFPLRRLHCCFFNLQE